MKLSRDTTVSDVTKLMSCLNLSVSLLQKLKYTFFNWILEILLSLTIFYRKTRNLVASMILSSSYAVKMGRRASVRFLFDFNIQIILFLGTGGTIFEVYCSFYAQISWNLWVLIKMICLIDIAVHRALSAWRIVLYGRFRLLDQWCDFVQVLPFINFFFVRIVRF